MDFLIDPYRLTPAIPACFELVQIETQQFDPTLGMNTGGAAITARNLFLSYLQSYESADLNHLTAGPPGTTNRVRLSQPRSIWTIGTMTTDNNFLFAYIANTANTASYPGRFNTTAPTAGNWLDSDSPVNIALSSPRNAFCCYITDLGDFSATLEFQFSLGGTPVKTVAIPYEDMNTSEVMHFAYLDGAKTFDKIRIQINQNDTEGNIDSVGFDDLVVGLALSCVA
jgi:hypothetical protein